MKKGKRILLVEDDKNLGFVVKDFLEISGYQVDLKENGKEGLRAFHENIYELCILDILLPLKDGFTLAAEIRKLDTCIPILFSTSKNLPPDKTRGFRIGGDAYITKPFSIEDLLAKIEAILNPCADAHLNTNPRCQIGNYIFDYEKNILIFEDQKTDLTRKESELLKLLCNRKNQLVKKETAQAVLWGESYMFLRGNMDAFISSLRKHLQHDPGISITDIRGMGFMLETKTSSPEQPGLLTKQ